MRISDWSSDVCSSDLAAIVDDNIDSGYFEAGFAGWTDEQMRNGAKPFGPGMKGWLENSPAFSVEHVRSPLLMVISDSFAGRAGVVAQGWEMFSRLRRSEERRVGKECVSTCRSWWST